MKTLIFKWEYLTHISDGIAMACQNLIQTLIKQGHYVTFVMPKATEELQTEKFQLISANNISLPSFINNSIFSFVHIIFLFINESHFKHIKEIKHQFSWAYDYNLMEEVYWLSWQRMYQQRTSMCVL